MPITARDMDVMQITSSVRYSVDPSGWGSGWKTVELGAETTSSPDRPWKEQQAKPYAKLSGQLKSLFLRTNDKE